MNPIYVPDGAAREYAELALNIYTECPHGCVYCYAALQAKRFGKPWTGNVEPRENLLESLKRQLDKGYVLAKNDKNNPTPTESRRVQLGGKLIHLCFDCDPYPCGFDTSITREVIKIIKDSGNHVQILTKGRDAERDFDLLDSNDWFGITFSGNDNFEPFAENPFERYGTLMKAREQGIKTWLSCEPVLNEFMIYLMIPYANVDLLRIGKLNHVGNNQRLKKIHDSINWYDFGHECEQLCEKHGRNYYIKDGLRKIMEVNHDA